LGINIKRGQHKTVVKAFLSNTTLTWFIAFSNWPM